jgi:uncharacterized protein
MHPIRLGGWLGGLLLLSACVTINIYFPAAQAEQAAEKIIQEIIRQPEAAPVSPPPPVKTPDQPPADSAAPKGRTTAARLLDFFIPAAAAAQPDFNIDTPEIRRLRAQMKERHPALAVYYATGTLGFGRNGLLVPRDAGGVPLAQRAGLNKLLAAENADREALYRAIAGANGHPEWAEQVRATFAAKWAELAEPGWWIESVGGWQRK